MRRFTVVSLIGVCLVIGITWLSYGLFHGLFDHGRFDVQQTTSALDGRVVVVGRRSDREALSGDQYFVVLGDHPFSPTDLKYAYYHDGLVFRAGGDCLTARWVGPHNVLIGCAGGSIAADQIAVERKRIGDISIAYDGIPSMLSK